MGAKSRLDRVSWALKHKNEIGLDLSFDGRAYLRRLYEDMAKVKVITKGAQLGISTFGMVDAWYALMELRYPLGVSIYFPTFNFANEFAKTKMDGFINSNPDIITFCEGAGRKTGTTGTADAKSLKKFENGACFYVRGLAGIAARTISVDKVILDELSALDAEKPLDDIQPNVIERMTSSTYQEELYLSTPMDEGQTIDLLYNDKECDQKVWMVKCPKCNEWSNLADHFPACIIEYRGEYQRVCYKCGCRLTNDVVDGGSWVAKNAIPNPYVSGYAPSQLDAPFITAAAIHRKYTKMNEAYFNRLVLGRAYTAKEDKLTIEELLKCIGNVEYNESEKTVIGVDPGVINHYYAILTHEAPHRLVKFGVIQYFDNLILLAKQFNSLRVVIDIGAERNMVRDMVEKLPVAYSNMYVETRLPIKCNDIKREISGSRTEMIDQMVSYIKSGNIILPDRHVLEEKIGDASFLQQMTKLNKVRGNTDGKSQLVKWTNGNPTHLFHAMTYACNGIQSTKGFENPFGWLQDEYQEDEKKAEEEVYV